MRETPQPQQYNPNKRLPLGMKIPDTPEFKTAIAQFNAEKSKQIKEQEAQKQIKKRIIKTPEEVAADRARLQKEIDKKREQIEKMN